MTYQNIKNHLGEDWLNDQIQFIESKKWVKDPKFRKDMSTSPGYRMLDEVNILIEELRDLEGFSQWVIEAKTSKNFEDCLFEILSLKELISKSDEIVLKPENPLNGRVPEAMIKKDEKYFYVEMTRLNSIPSSISSKVNDLYQKSRKKFKGSVGIHFVNVSDFLYYENEKFLKKPEWKELEGRLKLRFLHRKNKNILAFVLTHIYLAWNPKLKKTSVVKEYYIIRKPEERGGPKLSFFESIFDVDEFKVI